MTFLPRVCSRSTASLFRPAANVTIRNGTRNFCYIPNSEKNSLTFAGKALRIYGSVVAIMTLGGAVYGGYKGSEDSVRQLVYVDTKLKNCVPVLVDVSCGSIIGGCMGVVVGLASPFSFPLAGVFYIIQKRSSQKDYRWIYC